MTPHPTPHTPSDQPAYTRAADTSPGSSFGQLAQIIRERRTSLSVDRQRPLSAELVDQLCELAMWAPCHKKTWPARFASFTGDSRSSLGEACATDLEHAEIGDEAKWLKTRTKFLRAPTVLVVACRPDDRPGIHDENRDTVAAGIQNILLGAHSLGMASFWATPPVMSGSATLDVCGFDPTDRIIGIIYLGWPATVPPAPERPDAAVRHLG